MKKRRLYHIKCTVWEYYEVEATSRKEALEKPLEDPYIVDYQNKRIIKDPLADMA